MFDFENLKTNEIVKKLHNEFSNDYILIDKAHQIFTPAFFCTIFKPEIFSFIGLLDLNYGIGYGDDIDFCFRILNKGFSFAFVPESYVLHNHRTTFSSILSKEQIKNIIDSRLKQIYISYGLNTDGKKKGVIYTAITGSYDKLKMLSNIDTENFDYICFANEKIENPPNPWRIVYINDFSRALGYYDTNDHIRLARFFKLHPHLFFKNYEYSIWIDGNVDIIIQPIKILDLIPCNQFIFTSEHPSRTCIYQECLECKALKKDIPEKINEMEKFLKNENYPEYNGLVQTNFIVRKHNNEVCKKLMEEWWEFIKNYSRRDQLSFNYVFWKNKESYAYLPWNKINGTYIYLKTYLHGK